MDTTEDEFMEKILTMAQATPKGISDANIAQEIPNLKPEIRAKIINKLLAAGRITLLQLKNKELLYKLKDPAVLDAIKGADNEEKIVYGIIAQAGTKGIWYRFIRNKSQLAQTKLNKALKNLENRRSIKSIKHVEQGKKKLYMLYNLEPDESVTGGAWYSDQDFETEFVDVLNQQCFRFLEQKREAAKDSTSGPLSVRNKSYASAEEVLKFITDLQISKVKLSLNNIESILDTLIYDGKVQKTTNVYNMLYRAIDPLVPPTGLIKSPCGLCPIMNNCSDVGDVTPIKCEYFADWLKVST